MCGIAAIFGHNLKADVLQYAALMGGTIRHRGPDDEGYILIPAGGSPVLTFGHHDTPRDIYQQPWPYCPDKAYSTPPDEPYHGTMGHRRLSIVDLTAAAHQPMCSDDRQVWVSYNGEIYNYIELRQELISLGHTFHSQSDTEVLIHAYRQWGTSCLQRFNGMFAFVLYDSRKQEVFAARDRFGIKPLYYWISPHGTIHLASEIKAFTVLPHWHPILNGQLAYDFLNWGVHDHTGNTLFAGVRQLRGGEMLQFPVGQQHYGSVVPVSWYTLEPQSFSGTLDDAADKFRELLTDSVRLRLRADVPVGSCLSGGLDSSTIVCLANSLLRSKNAQHQQCTFTACSEVDAYDERDYAEAVVKKTGVDAHYTYPNLDELFSSSEKLVWYQDEPFGSTSIFAQWNLFSLAHENATKVLLDGQGADEQLCGYPGFFGNRLYELLTTLRWATLSKEIKRDDFFLLINKLMPHRIRQPLRAQMGKTSATVDWLDTNRLNAAVQDPFIGRKQNNVRDQSIQQMLYSSLPMLLHYEDRNSMAHSVEARTPFLDYRLVEFILGLPTDYKIADGWTKRLLRYSMRGVIPEEIRTRKDKMAFVTPEEVWMKEDSTDLFRHALHQAIGASGGLIKQSIADSFDRVIDGDLPFSHLYWRIISFGLWMQRFDVTI
ncbi:MAG: asparagine synthase (glutamine-hydrolyzing) [Chlamydiales bacterium]|nr:asparagine synthase (glutamine-hydrolyzing) [Chlamydiales bacterium]